jgi:TonB family protein
MCTRLIATVVCAAAISLAPLAATACPLRISYAALQATGTTHNYREYVAYLDGAQPDDVTASFLLAIANRSVAVRVDGVPLSPAGAATRKSWAVLFVVPRADVESIRVVDVRRNGRDTQSTCDDSKPFVIRPTNLTRDFSFDDTAGWLKKDGVTATEFTGPTLTSLLLPDYAARAHRKSLEGDVRVVAAVGTDGMVHDAEVVESSGSQELDAIAVSAALLLRFHPARLPELAGGALIDSIEDIGLTFTPGETTVQAHRAQR